MSIATNTGWGPYRWSLSSVFPGLSLFLGCHCQLAESARTFCLSAPFPAHRTVIQSQVQVSPPERCLPFLSSCLWRGLGALGLHGLCDGTRPPNHSLAGLLKLFTLECEAPDSSVRLGTGCCPSAFSRGKSGWLTRETGKVTSGCCQLFYTLLQWEAGRERAVRKPGAALGCVQGRYCIFSLLKFTPVLKPPGDFVPLPKWKAHSRWGVFVQPSSQAEQGSTACRITLKLGYLTWTCCLFLSVLHFGVLGVPHYKACVGGRDQVTV